jgi:hypothetical protein
MGRTKESGLTVAVTQAELIRRVAARIPLIISSPKTARVMEPGLVMDRSTTLQTGGESRACDSGQHRNCSGQCCEFGHRSSP